MEKFVLTKEMLRNADDYIPLNVKSAWVDAITPLCIDSLEISLGEDGKHNMPDMYMTSQERKSRFLMTALVRLYLHIPAPSIDGTTDVDPLSVEDYDWLAGSHLTNQIERMKSDAELRDKCFDILSDYKDLYKRLSAQIEAVLSVQNDSVVRQRMAMADEMEKLPEVLEELKNFGQRQENTDTEDR